MAEDWVIVSELPLRSKSLNIITWVGETLRQVGFGPVVKDSNRIFTFEEVDTGNKFEESWLMVEEGITDEDVKKVADLLDDAFIQ